MLFGSEPAAGGASVRGDELYGVRVRFTAAIHGFDVAP